MLFFTLVFSDADANCTENVLYEIDSGNLTCQCGVGCLDRHYLKQLSIATWPSKQYIVIKISDYKDTPGSGRAITKY